MRLPPAATKCLAVLLLAAGGGARADQAGCPLTPEVRATRKDRLWKSREAAWITGPLAAGSVPRATLPAPGDPLRGRWVRRATFALTGMPPREDDVRSFVADASPDAAEKVIRRLQASSAWGERMAQWWMPLVGYADQHPTASSAALRPTEAWRYRDWLVQSFNAGLGLDFFAEYHLSGDLEPPLAGGVNKPALTATTWLAFGPWPAAAEASTSREWAVDRSALAARRFASLETGCAACHDHPQLPITRADAATWASAWLGDRYLSADSAGHFALPRVPTAGSAALERRSAELAEMAAMREKMGALQEDFAREDAREFLPQTAEYVRAVAAWTASKPAAEEFASQLGLHPTAFAGWLTYLGTDGTPPPAIQKSTWYQTWREALASGDDSRIRDAAALIQKTHVLDAESPFVQLLTAEPEWLTLDHRQQLKRLSSRLQSLQKKLTSDEPVHAIQPAEPPAPPPVFSPAFVEMTRLPTEKPDRSQWRSPRQGLTSWLLKREPEILARSLVLAIWSGCEGPPLAPEPALLWSNEPPPNAPAIDALAGILIGSKWSLAAVQRAILLSPAWLGEPAPDWPRLAPRPLTPSEMRDATLLLTGRLDPRPRGLPEPADTSVRRSLYLRWSAGAPLLEPPTAATPGVPAGALAPLE